MIQSPKLNLLTAINSIQAIKSSLIFMRNDTLYASIYIYNAYYNE